MTTKTYTTFILAATCVLAVGACAHSSLPSTTGAPSDTSSSGPAASQDPATAPMSGIIFAAADDGIDTTVTTVRAIDPQSGTITATRTFTFPSEYLSAPGYMCEYMQCYSPDFSRMIVANNDGENEKVAVVSTDGTLTVLNDAIPTPNGHTPVSNHFAQFGPDGAIYVAHIDKDAASDRVGTIYRFPSETEAPEAVPTDFTVENYARFQVMPDLSIHRTKTAVWVANEAGVGCFGADAVTPGGTCLTIDQGTIYSKPGTPLAQTTPEDQTLLVSKWTKVSLPNLESTHTIEGWLAVSPDGTQMALYASPKDTYSDLSLHIFVAPVTGGDATQVTTTTDDVPGVVSILGWTQ